MSSSILISDNEKYLSYIRKFIFCWLLLLALPALFVFVVDPYQYFHKSFFKVAPFYKNNERYQVPGLIRNYLVKDDYDSVIVGTSLSSNISTEDLHKRLGWKALNLSMRDSGPLERGLVAQRAIDTGKVRHVFYEINPVDIVDDYPPPLDDPAFPSYLYTDNPFDRWHYLVNQTTVWYSLVLTLRKTSVNKLYYKYTNTLFFDGNAWGLGVEEWSEWLSMAEHDRWFEQYATPENLLKIKSDLHEHIKAQERETWNWQTNYPFVGATNSIVKVVRANPDVDFYIWFGPVSLLRYADEFNMDAINRSVELRRYLVNQLASEPNVRIYSFDNDLNIVSDLSNYMDNSHYSRKIIGYTLDEIARDSHRLTPGNIDAFVTAFRQNVMSFDIGVQKH